jgi:hypothetical protein
VALEQSFLEDLLFSPAYHCSTTAPYSCVITPRDV